MCRPHGVIGMGGGQLAFAADESARCAGWLPDGLETQVWHIAADGCLMDAELGPLELLCYRAARELRTVLRRAPGACTADPDVAALERTWS